MNNPLKSASRAMLAPLLISLAACSSTQGPGQPLALNKGGLSLLDRYDSAMVSQEEKENKAPGFLHKEGFFIGLQGLNTKVNNSDFDGATILTNGGTNEVLLVPELDRGTGLGLALGLRMEKGSIELSYQRTENEADFLGAKGDAALNTINIDMRWAPWQGSRLQPHFLGGVGFGWITVEDAAGQATGGSTVAVGDARFSGFLANLGLGLTYYLTEQLCFDATLGYRFMSCSSASGVADEVAELDDNLSASGMRFLCGLNLTF